MAQFQEMMRQQLESSMHTELELLLGTTTGAEKEVRLLVPSSLFLICVSNHLVVVKRVVGSKEKTGKTQK